MRLSRRRLLAVFATAALTGSVGQTTVTRQRFRALGTDAQITLAGRSPRAAAALAACRAEVLAIEAAFSLYNPDSMLSRLNRDGWVASDARFSRLLSHALAIAETTGGAFDPTIQPLWRALANGADSTAARGRVGWRGLLQHADSVRFAGPNMAASFNGIAQGFAADRVSAILAQHGFNNTLVDLGEFAARGTRREQRWLLGIHNPVSNTIQAHVEVTASAIATSEPHAMLVAGQPHIVDPMMRRGERWASVTVEAREAWRADALSTAIAASPRADAERLLAAGGAMRGWLITAAGELHQWHPTAKTRHTV